MEVMFSPHRRVTICDTLTDGVALAL